MTEPIATGPLPFQGARRMPDTLPFTVQQTRKKLVQQDLVLVPMVGLNMLTVSLLTWTHDDHGPTEMWLSRAVWAVVVVLSVASFVIVTVKLLHKRQLMVLGCDDDGVWLLVTPVLRRGMWLPWEAIECVTARPGRTHIHLRPIPDDPQWRAYAEAAPVNLGRRKRFELSLAHTDIPQHDVIANLKHFAHGRCAFIVYPR